MVSLRADEHRYIVTAAAREAALIRTIPGVRQVLATGALHAPRQPGTILALDDLFGDDGWTAAADLSTEVAEARQREHAPAVGEAIAELEGKEIAVGCQYGDKELVKLVPGYRWSAAQRRWFVPAQPMALRILERHFGEKLQTSEAVRDYLALKAIDEREAIERAGRETEAAPPPVVQEVEPSVAIARALDAVQAAGEPATSDEPLLARLDRLAGAVEELVDLLRGKFQHGESDEPASTAAPAASVEAVEGTLQADWRELLVEVHQNAAAAMPRVSGLLQTASQEHVPALRAVAGIAQCLLEEDEAALRSLRRAMDDAAALDEELATAARDAYTRSALRMFTAAMAPVRVPVRADDVLELLRVEIHGSGAGFSEEALTSKAAASVLEYLVNDPLLRVASPLLSDCCRVAHLLTVSRSGSWMVVDRVTDLLRDREIGPDGFGLAVAIMANALFDAASMDEWRYRWPSDDSGTAELRWLAEACLAQLPNAHTETAQLAALACLACIAGGPLEWATTEERRQLVKFIPLASHQRAYAEFLAAYQPAASGVKRIAEQFPGYLSVLQEQPLARSYTHMLDVFMMQESNHSGLAHRIAEDVIAVAVRKRGLNDPSVLLELMDLIAEAPKGDSRLNELASLIEDGEFIGSEAFSHEQRLVVYHRALDEARRRGHDVDGVAAFDRVVRERLAHGEADEVRSLCEELTGTFRAVRVQAAVYEVLLELQLEAGDPHDKTAEELLKLAKRPQAEELNLELDGLVLAYPELADLFGREEADATPPGGGRVVLIGGHEWLRKHAGRVLSAEWGLEVSWLGADTAKNGAQALALAAGSADLLVINAACISHAASGRVLAVVKETGMPFVMHHSRGVGALLSLVASALRQPAVAAS